MIFRDEYFRELESQGDDFAESFFSVSCEIAVARPLRQATPDERSEALRADIYAPV